MKAIILAGRRSGGRRQAAHAAAPGPLTPVAGVPALARVVQALRGTSFIDGGLLMGPAADAGGPHPAVSAILAAGDYGWMPPASGPAQSALDAARQLDAWPMLLTTADHALLQAEIVDGFCTDAAAKDADVVAGLTPHQAVQARFPAMRRTRLRFADGAYCGANLFYLGCPPAAKALAFWGAVQNLRKTPWRIAQRLGWRALIGHALGRLSVDQALAAISARAGCTIGWARVENPLAAIDVDTPADLAIAEQILQCQKPCS